MTVVDPLERIRRTLAARDEAGLRRTLRPRGPDEKVIDLSGNDYLGLSKHPRVIGAAAAACVEWGVGSTGSRLVSGTTRLHANLESALADFVGAAAGFVFSSGYLSNIGLLGALGGPDVTIVSDTLNHASIVDACQLSRSVVRVVSHCDVDAVETALANRSTQHAVVVTDAVFSVGGELAPLAALHRISRRHGALLVIDEAHSFGVTGYRGTGAALAAGLSGAADVILTVTLSKALGAQGGAVLGSREVVDLLVNVARPAIFDTALSPGVAGAALMALEILQHEPERAESVRANAAELANRLRALGLKASHPAAAVLSIVTGTPESASRAAAQCLSQGVRVACFRPPTVPVGCSCLRLAARSDLSVADLDAVVEAVASSV
ncbi:MAG: 8-amino-7-oxononanoate synthase [Pseudonocardiales bacterium]|nr:8-amino-7-oxononanoate synthase [Pseudonocardiales bacterium]